ncbi:MAG: YifB family Mg chelatase-like AAA ATPase [Mycobacteriales bacterium]
MTLARTSSVAVVGIEGQLVEIQADLADGLPGVTMIGLPDAALQEARDRIRAAIVNSGESWPTRRMTLALLPATLPKRGSMFDVALAVAVLAAAGAVPAEPLADVVLLGELGLDGRLRPTRGTLPAVVAASRAGMRRVLVPAANLTEASLVPGVDVRGVAALADLLGFLRGEPDRISARPASRRRRRQERPAPDLRDVVGQAMGRRAVEIAAAGGHHLLFAGPPGSGKTMLAERLPGVLPPLRIDEALEVSAVHSVAGLLPADSPLVRRPPYQAPHHTASTAALVGGGSVHARPGAASLSHRGVLFLDEAPEFQSGVLDALRQPLESGEVAIARSGGVARYPARFQLVLAANPCPCAAPAGEAECRCTSTAKRRYFGRISGPLLDRVDLQVWLQPVSPADLLGGRSEPEPSAPVAARVLSARSAAAERLRGTGWRINADVPGPALRTRWRLPASVTGGADLRLDRGELSARGYDRVLRIAWSIADLAGSDRPSATDVDEAVQLRSRWVAT